ncbi:MAG: hypothetical protein WBX25_37205 [Rhodomicrobium sp.]
MFSRNVRRDQDALCAYPALAALNDECLRALNDEMTAATPEPRDESKIYKDSSDYFDDECQRRFGDWPICVSDLQTVSNYDHIPDRTIWQSLKMLADPELEGDWHERVIPNPTD